MRSIFIERSIKNALSFLKDMVASDDMARHPGLLQSIDPRVKIFILFAFLITALLVRTIPVMLLFYCVSIIMALLSGVNIIYFIKRVWFFIPIFTLVIAIPAIFMQNFYVAALFFLRVTTCVSFAVLFTITTRHNMMIRALRSLGMSAVFAGVFDMAYRYIFLFIEIFEDMHLALKARLVGNLDGKASRGWVASRMGYLFKRSVYMSEDVYLAMVARGYTIESVQAGKVRDGG